jgi:guanylate kinase
MKSPLFIISGPSGSGQDSVIEGLAKLMPIERVVTTTTRPLRTGESEGLPYHFISQEAFEKGLQEGAFLEHARHYGGEYYGVTREEIERVRNSRKIGIWKVDWQGVANIKEIFPETTAILITAPLDVLEARLRLRDPNRSETSLHERMVYSKEYLSHVDLYDFVIENKDGKLDEAVQKVFRILNSPLAGAGL